MDDIPRMPSPLTRTSRARDGQGVAIMNEWAMVGIGLVLTVGTGIFVAAEFALVNLDRHDL
jgi:hypothetical protein